MTVETWKLVVEIAKDVRAYLRENPSRRGLVAVVCTSAAVVVVAGVLWGGSLQAKEPGAAVNITGSNFNAPAMVGNGNTQNNTTNNYVNQAAYWEKIVRERSVDGEGKHHMRVTFLPSKGMWQPGIRHVFGIQLKGACKSWSSNTSAVFGRLLTMVEETNRQETDRVFFATQTAPAPGQAMSFDIVDDEPIDIVEVAALPGPPA